MKNHNGHIFLEVDKLILLLVISFFVMVANAQEQGCVNVPCFKGGQFCIEDDRILAGSTISITSSNPIVNSVSIGFQHIENSRICVFATIVQISPGTAQFYYTITGPDGQVICHGPLNRCVPNMKMDKSLCMTDSIIKPGNCQNGLKRFDVCLGDTTRFYIDSTDIADNSTNGFIPFKFKKGSLLRNGKNNFDMFWHSPGLDCLEFQNVSWQVNFTQGYQVNVIEKQKLIIQSSHDLTQSICSSESINFTISNTSGPYLWRLSDGRIWTDHQAKITFTESGSYFLIAESALDCHCLLPDTVFFDVKSGTLPEIACIGPVCSGAEVMYSTPSSCPLYFWNVSPEGEIIDGGTQQDAYVKVKWKDGQNGKLELSTPLCLNTNCKSVVTHTIPIIELNGIINGQDTVCQFGQKTYTVNHYDGTNYQWFANGNPIGNNTAQLDIAFTANYGSMVTLKVEYENCFLGCKGQATKVINILPQFILASTKTKYCIGSDVVVENDMNQELNWTLIAPDGSISNASGLQLKFKSLESGTYEIIGESSVLMTCNRSASIKIIIIANPLAPQDIIGPEFICKDEPTTFSINSLESGETARWTVYDTNNRYYWGEKITHTWSRIDINIVSVRITNADGCVSNIFEKSFRNKIDINGTKELCLGDDYDYEITNLSTNDIVWRIIPDSFGLIVNNEGNKITVKALREGSFSISASYCNLSSKLNVIVPSTKFDFNLDYETVCYDRKPSVTVVAPLSYSIKIFDENDSIVSIKRTSFLPSGEYTVQVSSEIGCPASLVKHFELKNHPEFTVTLISSGSTSFCDATNNVILSVKDPKPDFKYRWRFNQINLPDTIASILTIGFGVYQVTVTNGDGCMDIQSVVIKQCCDDPAPSISFKSDKTDHNCYHKTFKILPPYLSTKVDWTIYYKNRVEYQTANVDEISYNFNQVGWYFVEAKGDQCLQPVLVCGLETIPCERALINVYIPYISNFIAENDCNPLTKIFKDVSEYDIDTLGIKYSWNFGDPSSGINNFSTERSPIHKYGSPGQYIVSQEITDFYGCISIKKDTVTVFENKPVIINVPLTICEKTSLHCSASSENVKYKYEWNFGDPASKTLNDAEGKFVSHTYAKNGTYNLHLKTYLKRCLIQESIFSIVVTKSSGKINIISDTALPKCPLDTVKLSTKQVGIAYQWSNGETTATINVSVAKTYSVTVLDSSGCSNYSDPFYLINNSIHNSRIRAYIGQNSAQSFRDSIEICEGQSVSLYTDNNLPNIKHNWEPFNGDNSSIVLTPTKLIVGRHIIKVSLMGNDGCLFICPPFVINVRPNPEIPIIDKVGNTNCISDVKEIFVKNPQPEHFYKWSNKDDKYEKNLVKISHNNDIFYQVKVKNQFGCNAISNIISLGTPTSKPSWLSGCRDVCFPHPICIQTNEVDHIYLYKDGIRSVKLNDTSSFINIMEPGSYHLQSEFDNGCTTVSDKLDINAIPIAHSLSGIAYIDYNKNNIYESGVDSLLPNVKVHLLHNEKILHTILTDINGFYHFDSLTTPNLKVLFETNLIGYHDAIFRDSTLNFKNCNDNKTIDYPIQFNCKVSSSIQHFQSCDGDSLAFLGKYYHENTLDTIIVNNFQGCDSIIFIHVSFKEKPNLTIESKPSCNNSKSGSFSIVNMDQTSQYWLSDSIKIENNMVSQLAPGTYKLVVRDSNGCTINDSINIESYPDINVILDIQNTCLNSLDGKVTVKSNAFDNLYKIDHLASYENNSTWEDLSEGDFNLFIKDKNECFDTVAFSIRTWASAKYNVKQKPTCSDSFTGAITLDTYDVFNQVIWKDVNDKNILETVNLPSGSYYLYLKDTFGCTYLDTVKIDTVIKPSFDIIITPSCINNAFGKISIENGSPNNYYNIEKSIAFFGNREVQNLSFGLHKIFITDSLGCQTFDEFYIDSIPSILPNIKLVPQNSCFDIPTGSITLDVPTTTTIYMNGIILPNDSIISSLSAGKYIFMFKDLNGCEYVKDINIGTYPTLDVIFPDLDANCYFGSQVIEPIVTASADKLMYRWSTGDTLAQINITNSGRYKVTISDQCLSKSDEWYLNILEDEINEKIYVPNIFMRSSLSENNCFIPKFSKDIDVLTYYLHIYDRWGNKVFDARDLDDCWDGKYKTLNAELGVYFYIIDFTYLICGQEKKDRKYGDVTVVH